MTLLNEDSILKKLPKIKFEQFLILDSVRFIIEIIDINYSELINELKKMSLNEEKNIPKAFNCAWNIIDNTQRLIEIYKKFPQENESLLFKEIVNIKFFRHTYQHLEDRIGEIIIDKQLPVFGALKWGANFNNKTTSFLAVSGNIYGSKLKILNPQSIENDSNISKISLITTVRQNRITSEKEISISELMKNLKSNISTLENKLLIQSLESNTPQINRKSVQDILLIFQTE